MKEIYISPSKAFLATQCFKWQEVKSGNRLKASGKNSQDGIDRHKEIENDISIVKRYLPDGWEKMEISQERNIEFSLKIKGYKITLKGIVDCVIIGKKTYIYDWKTGGSDIEKLTEDQLILYAYSIDTKEYELIYVNPDLNTSFTRKYSRKEIEEKANEILNKIILQKESARYSVGSHCLYCPAKDSCPELVKELNDLLSPKINSKPIEDLSEKQLDLIMIGEKVIESYKNKIKTYLSFNPDKTLHGYTLSNRPGIRAFKIGSDLKEIAKVLKIKFEDLFEKKIKSVKTLEDEGADIKAVQEYIVQPFSKTLKKGKE